MDTQTLEAPSGWTSSYLPIGWCPNNVVYGVRKVTKSQAGLSALDILITILVLAVLLFAAANQFGAYDGLSVPPAEQSGETEQ